MINGILSPSGAEEMSWDDIQRKRRMAEALMAQGTDTSPVGHWTQGLARVLQAGIGGYKNNRMKAEETASNKPINDAIAAYLRGQGGASPSPSPVAPSAAMTTADAGAAPKPVSFSGSQGDFIKAMMPHAMKVAEATGLDPRLVIAQSALETGYGRSAPGNNFFGIKSHGQSGGNTLPTTEVVNGQPVRENASFRAYGGMGDSAADYAAFLKANPRYKEVLGAQGLDAQIAAMARSGYATDPMYGNKLRQIAAGIQLPQSQPTQVASLDGLPPGPVPSGQPMAYAPPQGQPQQPPGMIPGASPMLPSDGFQPRQAPAQAAIAQAAPPMPPPRPQGLGDAPAPNAVPAGPAPSPQAVANVLNPQAARPQSPDPRTALLAAALSPRANPQLRQTAMQLYQMGEKQGQVKPVDMGNVIGFVDARGNIVRTVPKQKDAQFGVIGQDQFGTNQYGFIDPSRGRVTPANPAQGQAAKAEVTTADGRKIPVPDGMDPKEFRKSVTQEGAKSIVGAPDALRKAQEGIALIRATRNHPGLYWGTGATSVFPDLPGTDRRAFAAYHDQLKGQSFLQAFETLKGGGQITQIEGEKATQAIARLDRAQSPKDYQKALDDLEAILSGAVGRLQKMPGMPAPAEQPNSGQPPRRRFNPATGSIE